MTPLSDEYIANIVFPLWVDFYLIIPFDKEIGRFNTI